MRVLIVDDDRDSAQLTAECLQMDSEITVQIACDGAAAPRIAREFAPNTVLLDVQLSDLCGLELAPQIKAVSPARSTRIIIFSGSVNEPMRGNYPPALMSG